jgi:2-methylisocitrate lyase-like PEP mutase family enzyme
VISASEMTGKIKAALDARQSDGTLLIARTDAVAVEGFEAALDRADRYAEAGADLIFVEAPRSKEQLAAIATRFADRKPVMANMVEGGQTPLLSAAELKALGFQLVIFPGGTVRALAFALQQYFGSLEVNGTTAPFRDRMLDFAGINRLLRTDDFLARGKAYDKEAAE